jgi:hypothetical protein
VDLGLPEAEFWRLSLREFDLLCARKRVLERKTDYNTALVACMIYNVNRGKGKRAIHPEDLIGPGERPRQRRMTETEMKDQLRRIVQPGGSRCRKP